jgi:pyruvate/2-oxoglutarate dehydrogenase complex dihydrolipoamide acyltransferase (E2) component
MNVDSIGDQWRRVTFGRATGADPSGGLSSGGRVGNAAAMNNVDGPLGGPLSRADHPGPAPELAGRGGAGRDRGVEVRPFPSTRRLVTAAVRAGRRIVPMHGLLEVDVTEARRLLVAHGPPLSLTAFVVASVARAAAAHPEVHAYRDWRGRLVRHRHVDVQTLIEVATEQGPFGLVHVVRDADLRDVPDISAEVRAVKADLDATGTGRLLRRFGPAAARVPGLFSAMYAVMSRSKRVHLATGTVQVTAVGMFAGGAGFAIAPPTLASLVVVVGGLSRRPTAVDDQIVIHDVLDLTITIDHNVVDGAPATRFGAELRRLMESAAALAPKHPPKAA